MKLYRSGVLIFSLQYSKPGIYLIKYYMIKILFTSNRIIIVKVRRQDNWKADLESQAS